MMNTKHKKMGVVLALGFVAAIAIFASLVDGHREAQVVDTVPPKWPRAALMQGLEGAVMMELKIDDAGSVIGAKVTQSTNAIFNNNALEAVKQWKFAANNAGTYNYQLDFNMED